MMRKGLLQSLWHPAFGLRASAAVAGDGDHTQHTIRQRLTGKRPPLCFPYSIYGSLGVDPGSAISGFGPGIVTGGSIYGLGGVSNLAQADALAAYTTLALLPFPGANDLTGQDLGTLGHWLSPGVYHFDTTAGLTGTLTLDFATNRGGILVFQIGTALTTARCSTVNVVNGGPGGEVYWVIGSSATLGTSTMFAGNILADQSITLNTNADILCGRAIALNAAVTMNTNRISNNNSAEDFGSGSPAPAVPEPSTMLLLGSGLAGLLAFRKRSKKA